MIKIIIGFVIFCITLFCYLHIQFHLKTSDELEIYEIEQASKDKMEEICDLRQPVIFDYHNQELIEKCNLSNLEEQYGAFDIKLRNINEDYY